jgi:hypothetical protein
MASEAGGALTLDTAADALVRVRELVPGLTPAVLDDESLFRFLVARQYVRHVHAHAPCAHVRLSVCADMRACPSVCLCARLCVCVRVS